MNETTPSLAAVATTAPAASEPAPSNGKRRMSLMELSLLALLVGVVTGFGAVGFRDLIGLVHNLAFTGQLSFALRRQRLHRRVALGRAR